MNRKPSWLFRQSAAIPYLDSPDGYRIVLVTNGKRTGWIYPKGIVERDMTPEDSAAKEALEEAGVVGEVSSDLLNTYSYEKWGGVCEVQVFPLLVEDLLEDWDEAGYRDRTVVDFDAALELVRSEQRDGLVALGDYLRADG